MRVIIVLILLLCNGTFAWTADIKPIPAPVQRSNAQLKTRSVIKRITELKQIKFKGQPTVVKLPDSEPDKKPRNVVITPDTDATYKNGSGVVLRPASLKDFITGSVG